MTPDGRRCVVGTLKGRCRFYTVEQGGLEYEALIGESARRRVSVPTNFVPGWSKGMSVLRGNMFGI